MKKYKNYVMLFFMLVMFVLVFKYSTIVKSSIISSMELWLFNLVPSMLPMYFIIDLSINYGLLDLLYRMFKNNSFLLAIIAFTSGTPSNAKYIKEFYENECITKREAENLLLCSYSPSPLFILTISKDVKTALIILGYVYITNLFLFLFFRKRGTKLTNVKTVRRISFSDALSESMLKSINVLLLILGVIVFFGLINSFLTTLGIESLLLSSVLELTNAIARINLSGGSIYMLLFAVSFGGLSIHTQIKSILENTDLSYRYFLTGRLIASIPVFFMSFFY